MTEFGEGPSARAGDATLAAIGEAVLALWRSVRAEGRLPSVPEMNRIWEMCERAGNPSEES